MRGFTRELPELWLWDLPIKWSRLFSVQRCMKTDASRHFYFQLFTTLCRFSIFSVVIHHAFEVSVDMFVTVQTVCESSFQIVFTHYSHFHFVSVQCKHTWSNLGNKWSYNYIIIVIFSSLFIFEYVKIVKSRHISRFMCAFLIEHLSWYALFNLPCCKYMHSTWKCHQSWWDVSNLLYIIHVIFVSKVLLFNQLLGCYCHLAANDPLINLRMTVMYQHACLFFIPQVHTAILCNSW